MPDGVEEKVRRSAEREEVTIAALAQLYDQGYRRFLRLAEAVVRETLFRRLAASVAPGGTLLIVGPSDQQTTSSHASAPEAHVTAEEVAAMLDPHRWDIAVAEVRPRSVTRHDGHEITIRDAVLRARKRPTA